MDQSARTFGRNAVEMGKNKAPQAIFPGLSGFHACLSGINSTANTQKRSLPLHLGAQPILCLEGTSDRRIATVGSSPIGPFARSPAHPGHHARGQRVRAVKDHVLPVGAEPAVHGSGQTDWSQMESCNCLWNCPNPASAGCA